MAVAFYMDENVPHAVANGLRQRGVDVLTPQEDGTMSWKDPDLLNRATALDRVIFTQDDDFLVEAAYRQAQGTDFGGVIYMHHLNFTIGKCVDDLEVIAKADDANNLRNKVVYLPL